MVVLVDFVAFRPPDQCRIRYEETDAIMDGWRAWGPGHQISRCENIHIMKRFYKTTGIAGGFSPDNIVVPQGAAAAPHKGFNAAMREARLCMCGAVGELLDKTGLRGRDIDILVTCCSSFNPIPTLASMLVNEFKMREDVRSFHLGGMACSAGAIAIQLVADLLKAHPGSNALLVTHENLTQGFYPGGDASMLLSNVLFRMGGAALLFSNKRRVRGQRGLLRPKYELLHSARVHVGADDACYHSMGQFREDDEGTAACAFTYDTPAAAQRAVTAVLKRIAPRILSWHQLAQAAVNALQRRLGAKDVPPFSPAFGDCIDHFMLHPGIHGMLRGFQRGLRLPVEKVLPSAAALRDYGNTSASSTFYVLAYLEAVGGGVRAGETVLQLSVGTGVKAGVNVFRALRSVRDPHPAWAHLAGAPVTEADLLLPLSGKAGGDEMAATTQLFRELMDREGRTEGEPIGAPRPPQQEPQQQDQQQQTCRKRRPNELQLAEERGMAPLLNGRRV